MFVCFCIALFWFGFHSSSIAPYLPIMRAYIVINFSVWLELLLRSKRCNGKFFRHYHNQQTYCSYGYGFRADSIFAPSQWGTALLCNDVSHWLGASLESDLGFIWRRCYSLRREIWMPMKYCEILLLFMRWPTTILNVSTCALRGILPNIVDNDKFNKWENKLDELLNPFEQITWQYHDNDEENSSSTNRNGGEFLNKFSENICSLLKHDPKLINYIW